MSTAVLQTPIPPDLVANDELYEVIDGKRVRQSPTAYYSVLLASILYSELSNFVCAAKLGRAVQEALFALPAHIGRNRRPDVAFVSYQRWPKTRPLSRTADAWDVVPNVTTEVVSPNDDAEELLAKIDEYFRAGVELVWVVYPQRNQVYVYDSPTKITVLGANDVLDGGAALPGFRFPLAELFSEPAEQA